MSTYEDSPAFPIVHPDGSGVQYYGMSLRDYFAAKAMQGFAASPSMIDSNDSRAISYVAAASYAMADAMLEARK